MSDRSTIYDCHGPFHERPDLWWPVYVENVCYLSNDIFEGKTALKVAATPLVSDPEWHDLPPVQIASLGSFTTPRADMPAVWTGHTPQPWYGVTVTRPPEHVPDIPPIPLPAGFGLMITALAALMIMKGLRG